MQGKSRGPKKTLGFSPFWALASFAAVAALERRGGGGVVGEIGFTSYVLEKKLPPHFEKCGGKDFAS